MHYDVILSKFNNQYVAKALLLPEIQEHGSTREEVLARIQQRLQRYFVERQVELVQVEVTPHPSNCWLDSFGAFRDDPTFDDWQAEIATYRRAVDN